jgi:AraC-like DNA-binding protein
MDHTETSLSLAFSYILNFYDFAVLTTAVLAVLHIIPLLLKRDRLKSDLLLCGFLFSQGAIAVNTVFLYNKILGPETIQLLYPFHFVPLTILYGVQGFLLYWYSQAMMGETTKWLSRINLVGAVIVIVVAAMGVYWMINFGNAQGMKTPVVFFALPLSIIMGVRAILRLRQYDLEIRQRFSSIERIKLNWLWLATVGFVWVWTLVLISCVMGFLGYFEFAVMLGTFSNLPPMLLMSAMVIYSQTLPINIKVFDPPTPPQQQDNENKAVSFKSEQLEKIEDLMERVKIYQDPDLRLEGLADCMKISARSVSALLNGHFKKSFYDFINHYRVLDAKAQLRCADSKNKTIQRIFEDAGFNSKTTFNTLFKKITGYTPSDYRKLPIEP